MDVVGFAEKFMGVELKLWQKEHLRMLDRLGTDAKIYICMPKDNGLSQLYVYMKQKEMIPNGSTNDCKY